MPINLPQKMIQLGELNFLDAEEVAWARLSIESTKESIDPEHSSSILPEQPREGETVDERFDTADESTVVLDVAAFRTSTPPRRSKINGSSSPSPSSPSVIADIVAEDLASSDENLGTAPEGSQQDKSSSPATRADSSSVSLTAEGMVTAPNGIDPETSLSSPEPGHSVSASVVDEMVTAPIGLGVAASPTDTLSSDEEKTLELPGFDIAAVLASIQPRVENSRDDSWHLDNDRGGSPTPRSPSTSFGEPSPPPSDGEVEANGRGDNEDGEETPEEEEEEGDGDDEEEEEAEEGLVATVGPARATRAHANLLAEVARYRAYPTTHGSVRGHAQEPVMRRSLRR